LLSAGVIFSLTIGWFSFEIYFLFLIVSFSNKNRKNFNSTWEGQNATKQNGAGRSGSSFGIFGLFVGSRELQMCLL
jgi:hypothetical protein